MKQLCILLFLTAVNIDNDIMAQSIFPSGFNTAGGTDAIGVYNIEWAIGDIFVANSSASGIIITPGTVQPVKFGTTGIIKTQAAIDVKVYPNPAQNKIYLQSNLEEATDFSYNIYNLSGERIAGNTILLRNSEKYTIDVSSFPQGNYVLNVSMKVNGEKLIFNYKIQKL